MLEKPVSEEVKTTVRYSIEPTREGMDKIPRKSGLYFFYDENNRLLYIGRAKVLRSRVREHYHSYLYHLEGMFHARIFKRMGWNEGNKDEWDENFRKSWGDFVVENLGRRNLQNIDCDWYKVKRIEIEEMPHEDTKEQEKIMIKQYDPLYNSRDAPTISDEYYEAQDIFGENSSENS